MNDGLEGFLAFVAWTMFVVFLTGGLVGLHIRKETMKEGFTHGKTVQCLGKGGYHWTCEDDR